MVSKLVESPITVMFSCLGLLVISFGVVAASFNSSLEKKVNQDVFRQAMESVAKEMNDVRSEMARADSAIRAETAKEFSHREAVATDLGKKIECLTDSLNTLNTIMARMDERWRLDRREPLK